MSIERLLSSHDPRHDPLPWPLTFATSEEIQAYQTKVIEVRRQEEAERAALTVTVMARMQEEADKRRCEELERRRTDKNHVRSRLKVPTHCPVLGISLDGRDWSHSPNMDRHDNSKSYYSVDNVYIISQRANRLKSDATVEELEAVLRYMKNPPDQGIILSTTPHPGWRSDVRRRLKPQTEPARSRGQS